MTQLFVNNAQSTLAGNISNTATTLSVQAGAGALFPIPTGGNFFKITLIDAATGLLNEIMNVFTASGDTFSGIQRGQEGTTALNWSAGDGVFAFVTAGSLSSLLQQGQYQTQSANYAIDIGTANTIVAALSPVPASLASMIGAPVRIKIANNNTGATTLNLNGLGAIPVGNPNLTALTTAQLIAGQVAELFYDGSRFQLVSPVPTNTAAGVLTGTYSSGPTLVASGVTNGTYRNSQISVGVDGRVTAAQESSRFVQGYGSVGTNTFTVPANVTWMKFKAWGAGGGGGGSTASLASAGGGAGGGAYLEVWSPVTPTETITITVGGGGTGGATASGTNGGNTTITHTAGTILAVPGGGFGSLGNGSGGAAGSGGGAGSSYLTNYVSVNGFNGGAGGPYGTGSFGGEGGGSPFGASTTKISGGTALNSAPGAPGYFPGGGGGGGAGGSNGGGGGNGFAILEY